MKLCDLTIQERSSLFLKIASTTFLYCLLFLGSNARGGHIIHVGPVASGGGGPNPVSVPPVNPIEYEYIWLHGKNKELRVSISPGLFYGIRTSEKGFYVSAGTGIITHQSGVGIGVYSAFGFNGWCDNSCFNIEYLKAMGPIHQNLVSPYAVRMGMVFLK